MTCIVGIQHDGKVTIGGDSAGVAGYDIAARADTKVFRRGPYILGFTSSFRMGQLLRYTAELPIPDDSTRVDELDAFMVVDFVEAVRTTLNTGGYATIRNNAEIGGTFLVGIHGHLYAIDSDYQIGRAIDGYMSVGCGSDLALGALHATSRRAPRYRIEAALNAAAHHSAGVCAPYKIATA